MLDAIGLINFKLRFLAGADFSDDLLEQQIMKFFPVRRSIVLNIAAGVSENSADLFQSSLLAE